MEWDAQTDVKIGIVPSTMPLMILASTAIDHVKVDPADARKTCLSFLPTDAALFKTTSRDRVLLARQKESHEPILNWLNDTFKVDLMTTDEMIFRLQHSEESLRKLRNIVESMVLLPCTHHIILTVTHQTLCDYSGPLYVDMFAICVHGM